MSKLFPSMRHFSSSDYAFFYEPSDDTYLLVDALEAEFGNIKSRRERCLCLEMGSGSGAVTCSLALLSRGRNQSQCPSPSPAALPSPSEGTGGATIQECPDSTAAFPLFCVAADLNPLAAEATQRTAKSNNLGAWVDCVVTNLFSAFRTCPREVADGSAPSPAEAQGTGVRFDVMIFNPPYVPSTREELEEGGIDAAWAGGEKGMEVTDKFLQQMPTFLERHGFLYLLLEKRNEPETVIEKLKRKNKMLCEKVLARRAKNESLSIWRIHRLPV
uniref:Methyltransferase small domain-containing protein n=1 Tax=Chromera velia CCMP2878 TaxID=1169474 RepID=A0A0G4FS92_9ALVE|eukprot:Cvel_18517.t1-p1 / transcript=Cvel_18517.t1 / gene=Cvel_18517 / organism=Chromera_velia_CCMP2878 / gene_product=HemK methyltransferase family member 2, putative / transcript_product=HemK methyltransferase family member 2, putative / location=Cvel_scaffold1538:31731-34209(+) / protein_length=272 / sequence_SO=supercontig / SO=protein_coding / is_pseudo=false